MSREYCIEQEFVVRLFSDEVGLPLADAITHGRVRNLEELKRAFGALVDDMWEVGIEQWRARQNKKI